ncbi:restriction endonuclease [Zobellella sp. DQSA1]|uniref:restriction endonuclease n=1 Tax=Zobellella sp. DQSA1 TaxID=3342386 RepID=UPI0035BF8786
MMDLVVDQIYSGSRNGNHSDEVLPKLLGVDNGAGFFRDTKFLGLAVPGAKGMTADEDLTAVWRTTSNGVRFQNYRSIFTILNVAVVSRKWIEDAQNGNARTSSHAPKEWLEWVQRRRYLPLICESGKTIRTPKEQTDLTKEEKKIISYIHGRYKDKHNAYKFEVIAAEIVSLAMPDARNIIVTRPWRDGGRDAVGKYLIGSENSGIEVDFAMEAKCYAINHGVGVKAVSRLISRLLHRQFGILVTTSYVGQQAYRELVQDGHPVVILCAVDIAKLLISKIGQLEQIKIWIESCEYSS